MKKNNLMQVAIFGLLIGFSFNQSHAATESSAVSGSAAATSSSSLPADDQNNQEGAKFLETNKNKSSVITLPSGLQYEVLEEGTGKKPTAQDTVKVDYEGRLLNGKVFDSSYERGQPISFPVTGVIAGWQEALQLMNTGSTWMLYIPANLAYGKTGAGGMIGPDETLVFKVHLISIQ